MFFDDFLEGVAAKKVQLVASRRRARCQLEKMNIPTGDAGGENAVRNEMNPCWHS